MAFTSGILAFAAPSLTLNAINDTSKVRKTITSHLSCSTSSSAVTTIEQQEPSKKFSYSRASPSVRWPNRKEPADNHNSDKTQFPISPTNPKIDVFVNEPLTEVEGETAPLEENNETLEYSGRNSRGVAKKMTKLALKRAKDWRQRVKFLTDRILGLKSHEFVADVLDDRQVQMIPTDFCFLVKGIGKSNWQRALEVYEWLNLRKWYSPNARMLATILGVLGKA